MPETDPYEDVALILCGFLCENCPNELIELPNREYTPNSEWEKDMAELARSLHWSVRFDPKANDWKVLCPECSNKSGRSDR
ncbi:MAG TPA: hypothetical protein DD473_13475 [Planctomycetaceae bacterium]|nr:hypothetical protein [Planctomycetaceae bacterium]